GRLTSPAKAGIGVAPRSYTTIRDTTRADRKPESIRRQPECMVRPRNGKILACGKHKPYCILYN
ncbi:MAG: hypothetical protein K2Z25_24690, partial [Beijerinckiaceae bacterium]|nr:hypothetical protein [Beijerinckiaceae bacterium]